MTLPYENKITFASLAKEARLTDIDTRQRTLLAEYGTLAKKEIKSNAENRRMEAVLAELKGLAKTYNEVKAGKRS
jgi:hypothetical protein